MNKAYTRECQGMSRMRSTTPIASVCAGILSKHKGAYWLISRASFIVLPVSARRYHHLIASNRLPLPWVASEGPGQRGSRPLITDPRRTHRQLSTGPQRRPSRCIFTPPHQYLLLLLPTPPHHLFPSSSFFSFCLYAPLSSFSFPCLLLLVLFLLIFLRVTLYPYVLLSSFSLPYLLLLLFIFSPFTIYFNVPQ